MSSKKINKGDQMFKNIRSKYNLKKNIVEDKKDTDILTQLNSYNYAKVETYITELKKQLDEQKKLNSMLEDENYEDNVSQIEEFSKEYNEIIEDQRIRLNNIKDELNDIVMKNNELKNSKEQYRQLCNSSEYTELAMKIREIKKNCSSIKHFLEEMGIQNP